MSVTELPARGRPWPLPLGNATSRAEVDALVDEAHRAVDRLAVITAHVKAQLEVEAKALPAKFDFEATAEAWYASAIEPLRVKGIFDPQWNTQIDAYYKIIDGMAQLFTEWAPTAQRIELLMVRQTEIEERLDTLVDDVLEAKVRERG